MCFFQVRTGLGVAYKPGSGNVAVVRSELCSFMYSGTIGPDPHSALPGLKGGMHDQFGTSWLTAICLTDSEFRFNKKYADRDYHIEYVFRREPSGIWTGQYSSDPTGKGITRCVLIPIPETFFEIEEARAFLEENPLPPL